MTPAPAAVFKIPAESPQPFRGAVGRARRAAAKPKAAGLAAGRVAGAGTRAATRGDGEAIELGLGITVYPPRDEGGRRRAAWHEDGERQQCESVSEDKLAARLEKVRQRLSTGAASMTRPGADLIAWYLNPGRLPAEPRWSRKHADSQRRLCQRFAAPVIGAVACQDITAGHAQKIVNAAPAAGEGGRVHRMLSALAGAGIKGGYLVNPVLAEVHWQAGDRLLPAPKVTVAGASALLADPAEIPPGGDVAGLGRALAAGPQGDHGGPQGGRGRRPPVRRGAEEPQVPPDRLPAPDPGRVPARGAARRPHRRGTRRTGGRDQPARAGLPLADREALAVLQLQPQRPPARVPGRRMA